MMQNKRYRRVTRDRPTLLFACIACVAFLACFAGNAFAMQPLHKKAAQESATTAVEKQNSTPDQPKAEEKSEKPIPSLCEALEQRHPHHKNFQSEFSIFGGDYLGDEWLNTWNAGGKYYMHLSNMFAVGAEYFYSQIRANGNTTFGQSLKTNDSNTLDVQLMIANDTAFLSGRSIIDCDLFLTLGVGSMEINDIWEWTAIVGGGLKIYTGIPWFAVRFDVNSYLHPTPKPTGDSFNADITMTLGVSFLLPSRTLDADQSTVKQD
jgi:hypothetical protein